MMPDPTNPLAVDVRALRKSFGAQTVLDGINVQAPAGTVLALLGPNGAGKTTTVDILTTRSRPDGGSVRVLGLDVLASQREVRQRIAVARQDSTVDLFLTGRENLTIAARLLGRSPGRARRRADALLERFALTDAAGKRVENYSGGMRRRLDLAMCLVADPEVLFLDEPTTGLDPISRNALWEVVKGLVSMGTTIVLTTQYLEEADALADRIVMIAGGHVVADGTPAQLKSLMGSERIEVTVRHVAYIETAVRAAMSADVDDVTYDRSQCRVSARARNGMRSMLQLASSLYQAGVDVAAMSLREASLDEVFAALTTTPEQPVLAVQR